MDNIVKLDFEKIYLNKASDIMDQLQDKDLNAYELVDEIWGDFKGDITVKFNATVLDGSGMNSDGVKWFYSKLTTPIINCIFDYYPKFKKISFLDSLDNLILTAQNEDAS